MSAPELLRQQEFTLSLHIRDSASNSPPPGIEERRLAIYRDLFYNNIEGLLSGNFPVIREMLDDGPWHALIRAFFRDHSCRTHLFPEVPREFIRFLDMRRENGHDDPPWLVELAHYEWVELALDLAENDGPDEENTVPAEHILDTAFSLSPLAWPLGYQWPVHRLSPVYKPETPPDTPTFLLVRRDAQYKIHFGEISALVFRLLQMIGDSPESLARDHLDLLAAEAGAEDLDAFFELGIGLYENLQAQRTLRPAG